MRIAWNNCFSLGNADIVLFGVPDSSASMYKGSAQAPSEIRNASLRWETGCYSSGKKFVLLPQSAPMRRKLFDAGNIFKEDVEEFTQRLMRLKKVPGMLGGDHSLTVLALSGIAKGRKGKRPGIAMLDAHLDFVSSERNFYGSVLTELRAKKLVNFKKSVVIGARAFTGEEMQNAKKAGLKVFTPNDLEEKGAKKVLRAAKKRLGRSAYLSIDIDCVDPAFAPGVSDPIPGGLSTSALFYLARGLSRGMLAFDLVEVNPLEDFREHTAHLAAKLVAEIVA